MKRWMADKVQYIITLTITLLAMGIIVYYTFGSFYTVAKEDAITIGETAVKERAEKLNNFLLKSLEVINITGQTVDYMLQHGDDEKNIEHFIVQASNNYMERINENFTGIYGFINNTYVDGSGWIPDKDYNPKTRIWYTEALKGKGEPVIVSPYVDAQTKQVIISLTQLLSDGEDVVSLDIVLNDMQTLAEDINLNGNGYGFIMDKNGLVVAHSNANERGKNYLNDTAFQNTDVHSMATKIIQEKSNTIEVELNDELCTVFKQTVADDWYVVMVISTSDLFEKVENVLVTNIIISLLIFALVVYFCTSSHFHKIKAMHYADELKQYQLHLEERVLEQTKEIKQQAEEMIKMQENVIEGMATLIESRDENTGTHVKNTKQYVSMIANYMYDNKLHTDIITQAYVSKLITAAVLHDVGKIKISDLILNKPARLTKEEYEIMKTHSSLGENIVEIILGKHTDKELLQISRDVAKHHHERWDGTGYPNGLMGEDIPLAARIMAVADVFDALISKRVYKDRISVEAAFEMIKTESGRQFDPEIIDIFVGQYENIRRYLEKNY